MTKEMIKERFGEGLEKAKEFVKDNQKDILVFGGATTVTLLCCRKIEKNAFKAGAQTALKETAALRSLGRKVLNIAPEGDFYASEVSAKMLGNHVNNLELVSKYLTDPEISKDVAGVVIVTKA